MKFLILDNNGKMCTYDFDPQDIYDYVNAMDIEIHDSYIVPLELNKQDKNDPNLQTTNKDVVNAINEINAKLSVYEIPVNGFYASTTKYTSQELHDLLGYGSWENICDANNLDYLYPKAVKSTEVSNVVNNQTLPNIKGELPPSSIAKRQSGTPTGAFKTTTDGVIINWGGSSGNDNSWTLKFNANDSSGIYQDNANVHPTNYSIYLYRRTT